ncbi:unnamed protein product [Mycena citricolor]|uniref:RTA1-domain-containing protein n=1 Tax=Mycena citricolor TaxID=2018698 RepID=A0AAD2HKG0_9AGAR|nr:unnamed protein product [Mycena citricolor]
MQRARGDALGNNHLLVLRRVFSTWSPPFKTVSSLDVTVRIKADGQRRTNILNHFHLLVFLLMSRLALFLTFTTSLASVFAAELVERDTTDTSVHAGGYTPSRQLASMAIIAFAQSAIVSLIHFFWVRPMKVSLLTYTVGMFALTAGFLLRAMDTVAPFQLWKYITWDLLTLLSPSFFIATCYFLLAHLGNTFDPDVVSRSLAVSPSRIMTFFVGSNLVSFLLEGGGGAMTHSQNGSVAQTGSKIVLIGFILQAATLLLFIFLLISFTTRMSTDYPHLWKPDHVAKWKMMSAGPIENWRLLVYMIFIVCGGLLVSTVYRVVEYIGGYNGTVANKELYFYLFDALPLAMTTSMFITLWPARFLHHQGHRYSLRGEPSHEALKLNSFTEA